MERIIIKIIVGVAGRLMMLPWDTILTTRLPLNVLPIL